MRVGGEERGGESASFLCVVSLSWELCRRERERESVAATQTVGKKEERELHPKRDEEGGGGVGNRCVVAGGIS